MLGVGGDFKPERDTEILRSITTLEKIDEKPAAEFWKKYDAGREVKRVRQASCEARLPRPRLPAMGESHASSARREADRSRQQEADGVEPWVRWEALCSLGR